MGTLSINPPSKLGINPLCVRGSAVSMGGGYLVIKIKQL
jgi:hypothetical protein